MDRLKAYIIGNDPKVRVPVEHAIQRSDDLELIGSGDPRQLEDFRSEEGQFLLFIDLNFLEPSTSALLEKLRSAAEVIAVSSTASHAVKAFELGVKDFLLVPFSFDRFQKALDRIITRTGTQQNVPADRVQHSNNKELLLKSGKQVLSINSGQIELVQSMGNYTKLHLAHGHVLVNETMAHMEELLPAEAFVRVHRSYIISLASILAVGGNSIEWTGGDLIVGASYKKDAFKKIDDLLNSMPQRKGKSIPAK